MHYGMNLLMWTDTLTEEMLPLVDQLQEIGFDAIEIPVFDNDLDNYAKWGKRFDELGLVRSGTAVRGPDENPISSDPAVRRKGIDANKLTLDCCAAAGCRVMAGPFHSALGEFSGKGPTETPKRWVWCWASSISTASSATSSTRRPTALDSAATWTTRTAK